MQIKEIIEVIDELIDSRKDVLLSLKRKRWRESEKAMTGGKYKRQIEALGQLKSELEERK